MRNLSFSRMHIFCTFVTPIGSAALCLPPCTHDHSIQAGQDVDPVVLQVLPGQDVIAEYAVKQWEVRNSICSWAGEHAARLGPKP